MKNKHFLFFILYLQLLPICFSSISIAIDNTWNEMDILFTNIPNVFTASKKLEPIDDAPNVMYVFSKETIKKRGYKTLKDIIQSIPGFSPLMYREWATQVRGIGSNANEKIIVMINGHNIDELTEPAIYHGPISLMCAEQVEVILGPGSVLYGAETVGAIINIITKKPLSNETFLSTGTSEHLMSSTIIGERFNPTDYYMISLTYYKNGGFDAWDEKNFWTYPTPKGTDWTGKIYPSYFIVAKSHYQNYDIQFTSYEKRVPYEEISDRPDITKAGEFTNVVNTFVAKKEINLNKNKKLNLEVNYDSKRYIRMDTDVITKDGKGSNYDLSQRIYGFESSIQIDHDNNFFQSGIQYKYKINRQNYWYSWSPNPEAPASDGWIESIVEIGDTQSIGIYLSDDIKMSDKLKLTLAGRLDKDTVLDGDKVYPSIRTAAVYDVDKNWKTKLMHNTATRMPAHWMSPRNNLWGNDNPYAPGWASADTNATKPEKLSALEFQNIFNYNEFLIFQTTRIAINIYSQTLEDFITWIGPFSNAGDMRSHGIELDINAKLNNFNFMGFTINNMDLFGGLAILESKLENVASGSIHQADPDDNIGGVAKIQGIGGFDWEFYKNMTFSSTLRYLSNQPGFDKRTNKWSTYYHRYYIDAAFTIDKLFSQNLTFRLSGKNLLDNRKAVPAIFTNNLFYPRGRTIEISIISEF